MQLKKGDIVKGIRTIHPIIYLEDINENTFSGLILTHSTTEEYVDNLQLKSIHFQTHDTFGNPYEFIFDNSFVVLKRLIKKDEWGPYKKRIS